MTVALPFIMAGMSAVGAAGSASQSASNSDFNADVARTNAHQERLFATEDANRQRAEGSRRIGTMRSKVGASGVDLASGSVLDVITDEAITNELAALDISARAETRARASDSQASMFSAQASNTRKSAPLSILGAGLKGFAGGKQLIN